MKTPTAAQLIERFGLQPLTFEGGHFRQTYVAEESVAAEALPKRYGAPRTLGTAIYYLLTSEPDSFSALHRLETDEIYHFYLGDPVEMLLLHPDRHGERIVLGAGRSGRAARAVRGSARSVARVEANLRGQLRTDGDHYGAGLRSCRLGRRQTGSADSRVSRTR